MIKTAMAENGIFTHLMSILLQSATTGDCTAADKRGLLRNHAF